MTALVFFIPVLLVTQVKAVPTSVDEHNDGVLFLVRAPDPTENPGEIMTSGLATIAGETKMRTETKTKTETAMVQDQDTSERGDGVIKKRDWRNPQD